MKFKFHKKINASVQSALNVLFFDLLSASSVGHRYIEKKPDTERKKARKK